MAQVLIHKLTFNELFSSIQNDSNIVYEIEGDRAYFSYDGLGYSFFREGDLKSKFDVPKQSLLQYLRAMRVMLHCLKMTTVNPSDIWFKLILNRENEMIQILDAGISITNSSTYKKAKEYFNEISDTSYGKVYIFKNPGKFNVIDSLHNCFSCDQKLVFDEPISNIEKTLKKTIFLDFEKLLLLNCESKFQNWDSDKCKLVRIKTPRGELKVFRSAKWKITGDT